MGVAFLCWLFRANGRVNVPCQPKWGHSSIFQHSWAQSCAWICQFWIVAVGLKLLEGGVYHFCPVAKRFFVPPTNYTWSFPFFDDNHALSYLICLINCWQCVCGGSSFAPGGVLQSCCMPVGVCKLGQCQRMDWHSHIHFTSQMYQMHTFMWLSAVLFYACAHNIRKILADALSLSNYNVIALPFNCVPWWSQKTFFFVAHRIKYQHKLISQIPAHSNLNQTYPN